MNKYDNEDMGVETMLPNDIIALLVMKEPMIDNSINNTEPPLDEYESAMAA